MTSHYILNPFHKKSRQILENDILNPFHKKSRQIFENATSFSSKQNFELNHFMFIQNLANFFEIVISYFFFQNTQ
jgi:hypothetical protein